LDHEDFYFETNEIQQRLTQATVFFVVLLDLTIDI